MRKKLIAALLMVLVCTAVGCGNRNKDDSEESEESGVINVEDVGAAEIPGAGSDKADEADGTEAADGVNETPVYFQSADLLWILPKNFRALDGEEGVYVSKEYPTDSSTVTYVIAESDDNIADVSQDEFREMMEADFLDAYGDQVDINITNYEKISVSKRSGLRIDMEYEFKGAEYRQTAVMLYNGDESHIINYTQEKDGKWADEFESSISSLNFAD